MMTPGKFYFNLLLQVCNHNKEMKAQLQKSYNKSQQLVPLQQTGFKHPQLQHHVHLRQITSNQQQSDHEDEMTSLMDNEEEEEVEPEEQVEVEEGGSNADPLDAIASVFRQFQNVIDRTQSGESLGKRQRRAPVWTNLLLMFDREYNALCLKLNSF